MNIIDIISKKTLLPSPNVMVFINTAPYRYKNIICQKIVVAFVKLPNLHVS